MKHKQNKSIPLSYLGYSSQLRALDFFIDNHFFDFPLTEIARGSNVSYNSLTFIQNWLEKGIIVKTRKIGKAEYFQLNLKNQFVKNIIKLDWSLTEKTAMPEQEKLAAQ